MNSDNRRTEWLQATLHRATYLLRVSVLAGVLQCTSRISFRASFFADVASSLLLTAAQIIFWTVVIGKDGHVAAWSFPQIMVFMGYAELFWAIQRGFFYISVRFHDLINLGRLDMHLCRPLDVRVATLLLNMEPIFFLRSLPGAIAYFVLGFMAGANMTAVSLTEGTILLLLAVLAYTEILFTMTYVAFWWGNTNTLNPVVSGLWEFMRYPADLFEKAVRAIFTFVIPAMFAATWPAYVSLGKPTPGGFVGTFGLLLGLLVAWHGIQSLVWNRGLRRYESSGG